MSLKGTINDLRRFLASGGHIPRQSEFARADRMQREDNAAVRRARRPPAKRPRTSDPRYYRRPR